jgi:hypothetical protein
LSLLRSGVTFGFTDDECTYRIRVMADITGKEHYERFRLVLNKYDTSNPLVKSAFANIRKILKIRGEVIRYPVNASARYPRMWEGLSYL